MLYVKIESFQKENRENVHRNGINLSDTIQSNFLDLTNTHMQMKEPSEFLLQWLKIEP